MFLDFISDSSISAIQVWKEYFYYSWKYLIWDVTNETFQMCIRELLEELIIFGDSFLQVTWIKSFPCFKISVELILLILKGEELCVVRWGGSTGSLNSLGAIDYDGEKEIWFNLTLTKKHTNNKWMQEIRWKEKGLTLNRKKIIDYLSL